MTSRLKTFTWKVSTWPCRACESKGCRRCNNSGNALEYRKGPLHAERVEEFNKKMGYVSAPSQ